MHEWVTPLDGALRQAPGRPESHIDIPTPQPGTLFDPARRLVPSMNLAQVHAPFLFGGTSAASPLVQAQCHDRATSYHSVRRCKALTSRRPGSWPVSRSFWNTDLPMHQGTVTQVGNLLYRRLLTCASYAGTRCPAQPEPASPHARAGPTASRRYSRPPVCVTGAHRAL